MISLRRQGLVEAAVGSNFPAAEGCNVEASLMLAL
jgi:hypothetical protein